MRHSRHRAHIALCTFTLFGLLASMPASRATGADLSSMFPSDVAAAARAALTARPDLGMQAVGAAVAPASVPHALGSQPLQPTDFVTTAGFSFEPDTANRSVGTHAVPVGDVNGDGYSDFVAIGQVGAQASALYLFFGGPGGPTLAPGFPNETLPPYADVAPAGDVNGDGHDDVVVFWYTSGIARVLPGTATGLDFVHSNTLSFGANQIGMNVAPAGDVNGDGYGDILVGLPNQDGGFPCSPSPASGVADVFYGSSTGVSQGNYWYATGCYATGNGANLGASVAGVGDVNGDGYDDIAIGAPWADEPVGSPGNVYGKVYVMYGAAAGLPRLPGFANLGSITYGTAIVGHHLNAGFGATVAPGGDLNGDGYADIAIGAPFDNNFGTQSGMAFVFRGAAAGADTAQADLLWWESSGVAHSEMGITLTPAGDINGDGRPDLLVGEVSRIDVAQSAGATLFISQTLSYAPGSAAVMTAGDVNGDGLSDILVGESGYSNGQSLEGHVLVFYGTGSPPASSPAWSMTQTVISNPNLGWSVSSAGDVNGDGYDDVIVGAPTWYDWTTTGQSNNGLVLLFYGHATGLSPNYDWAYYGASGDQLGISVASGDVNGDGYSDLIIGSHTAAGGLGQVRVWYGGPSGPSTGAAIVTLTGFAAGSQFGASVACAGDVDGDGYPDVVVGAPYDVDPVSPHANEGRVYLYHGGAGGLATTPFWSESGGQADAHFGTSVAAAGDVNGDGFGDVVIGAPDYDNLNRFGMPITDAGRIYVEYGGHAGVASEQQLRAAATGRFGASVACAGDVNGDGYSDIIVGAPSAASTLPGEGSAQVLPGGPGGFGAALWTQYGGEANGGFGSSVCSAGDADGDGLSDVLVGAVFQDEGGPTDQGRVYLYRGPLTPGETPFWTASGGSTFANLGHSIANAGDVNLDGWPDYVFGMPGYSATYSRQGLCRSYLGARGQGSFQNEVAYHLGSPVHLIQPGCLTDAGQLTLASTARSAAGRARVRLQYAVTPVVGLPSAPAHTGLTAYSATGAPGTYGSLTAILATASPLVGGVPYAWSVRTLAHDVWYPSGPWRQPARSGRLEADVRAPGTWLGVAPGTTGPALELADVRPNPMLGSAWVAFSLAQAGPVTLEILDVQGRRIRSLARTTMDAGEHRIAWDGATDAGSPASAGLYLVRMQAGGHSLSRKLVRVR